MNGDSKAPNLSGAPARHNRSSPKVRSLTSVLSVEDSGAVRDKLVKEISALGSADVALAWALQRIGLKNGLTAEDASTVDEAFQEKIRVLAPDAYLETSPPKPAGAPEPGRPQTHPASTHKPSASNEEHAPAGESQNQSKGNGERKSLENTVGAGLLKPRRSRDKNHLQFITIQPCTVCGRQPCEAHHIRYAQPRALGRRVSDEFTVPLCRLHHRELHQQGNERTWWRKFNIDPMPIALRFWQHTRGIQTYQVGNFTTTSTVERARNMTAEQSSGDPSATRDNLFTDSARK